MVNENINVVKRNGRGKEPLNIEKIHQMVEYACEDITQVSASSVENSKKNLLLLRKKFMEAYRYFQHVGTGGNL